MSMGRGSSHWEQFYKQGSTIYYLKGKNIQAADIPDILLFLAQHPEITTLDVSINSIGAEGAKALAGNTTLTTLNVACNSIGAEGAKALAERNPVKRANLARKSGLPINHPYAAIPSLLRQSLFVVQQQLEKEWELRQDTTTNDVEIYDSKTATTSKAFIPDELREWLQRKI